MATTSNCRRKSTIEHSYEIPSMFPNHFLPFLLKLIVFSSISTLAASADDSVSQNCVAQRCENGPNITYPFILTGAHQAHCGSHGFELTCNRIGFPVLRLAENNAYVVENISYKTQTFHVYDESILGLNDSATCLPDIRNTSLPTLQFSYVNATMLHLFPNCSMSTAADFWPYRIICNRRGGNNYSDLAMNGDDAGLRVVAKKCGGQVVAPMGYERYNIYENLRAGFELKWKTGDCSACEKSGGRCGFDENANRFQCLCTDRTYNKTCDGAQTGRSAAMGPGPAPASADPGNFRENSKRKRLFRTGLIIAVPVAVALVISILILVFFRKRLLKLVRIRAAQPENRAAGIQLFLEDHRNLARKRYKYSQLKRITNSFSENLGRGGYGSVYKGKLQDGRPVAVKILSELKGNGEEFINEVSSISRTSHVNIVALLGFCFEGNKRALIYEFMPNGSLDRFIPSNSTASPASESTLGLEKLFEIAVRIARGIEYLHQGCTTRILHFDLKPHNILLDKDFMPKISDFGLAKLCPNRSSIVSMAGARGTAGYIAPEVFCRNFGEVLHKSDVYSYGMMILEMVIGRKNVDPQDGNASEINFSDWILKNLEPDNVATGVCCEVETSKEGEQKCVKRKLMIVGLWCIQTEPKNRPSISRVLEMLEGSLESLQIPLVPHLSSSPQRVNKSVSL